MRPLPPDGQSTQGLEDTRTPKPRLRAYALPIAAAIILAVAVGVYFFIDPSSSPVFPKCPFKVMTGMQCPGCGSQRAIHALLHGDIPSAWRFNALLVISVPVLAVMLPVQFMRRRHPQLYLKVFCTATIWTTFAVVTAWWIARNVWGW